MSEERFADQYISMSERYAVALADLEAVRGQIGELVVNSALSTDRVVVSSPEAGADMLTASEILNKRSDRRVTSANVREKYAENFELLQKIFEYRGQLIWWESTTPDRPVLEKVWRFNHEFMLGLIPDEVVLHAGPHLYLESKVTDQSRQHEEITDGTIPLSKIRPSEPLAWFIDRARLINEYALPEGVGQVHLPPERLLLGDEAVLDRMVELLTDPLIFESQSGYLNIEYPNLLRYLLHTGKLTDEMLAKVSEIVVQAHHKHSVEYEAAIESRNYWASKITRTTPRDSLPWKLFEDARHDLDIESLYKFRLRTMLEVIANHQGQTTAA